VALGEDGTQAFLPTRRRSPYDPTLGPIPRVPAYQLLAIPDTGPPDDPSPGLSILGAPTAETLGPAAPLALWTLPWLRHPSRTARGIRPPRHPASRRCGSVTDNPVCFLAAPGDPGAATPSVHAPRT
jgi:hypothetical protein